MTSSRNTIDHAGGILDELYLHARLLGQDTDQVVGLVHKQFFIRDLHRRAYEFSRYKVKVSVGLIRIKNLAASFSDKGSLADELDLIGNLLDENMRLTDLATWYGSNEFAIQMPHVDAEEACQACERMIEVLGVGLRFDADMEYQVSELNDTHTADLLLNNLRESRFRAPLEEPSMIF
jgi:PleD family two-component response regulator